MAFFINCPSIIMESRPPNLPYFLFLFWYFFFFINSINKTAKTQCLCLPRPVKCFQTNSLYVQITHIDHSFDLDHSPSFSPHFSKYEKTKTSVVFFYIILNRGYRRESYTFGRHPHRILQQTEGIKHAL